ncbi:MAG: hypothetical protein RSD57_14600 [Comamonas sp.]
MLMTPDPMLRWGDRRREDGGRRGQARTRQYERSLDKPEHKGARLALPSRYDLMHGPVYEPVAAAAPVRPGANDFLQIASLGVRC